MSSRDVCEYIWKKESECTRQQTAVTWQMDVSVSLDSLFEDEEDREEESEKEEKKVEVCDNDEKEISVHTFPGEVQLRIQEFGYHPHNAGRI